jgi:Flp pilus assembly protein TadB
MKNQPVEERGDMKTVIAALCCLTLAASPFAMAQTKTDDKKPATKTEAPKTETPKAEAKKEPSEAQKKQQDLMKACNEKAGTKKLAGEERKKFMSTCLKGDDAAPSAKQKAQQDKMTACNKTAGDKKLAGEERKKFMSTCLSG